MNKKKKSKENMVDKMPTGDRKVSEDLIIFQLNSLQENMEQIKNAQVRILTEIAALKVKAGAWGLLGGLIPVVIGLGIAAVK